MLIEVGHFALVLSLIISVLLIVVPSIGLYQNKTSLAQLARPLVWAQGFWIALAFFVLMSAFLSNDFSVKYVADNSNTQLPLLFKASAVWGSHEGSLLLWVFVLSLWTVAVSIFSKRIPSDLINQTLVVLGSISFGFLIFLLFTSNPFERLMMPPLEGRELNPLLQDFGLAVHPPMLYMGYVGLAIPFAFVLSALIRGQLDSTWIRWTRPWALVSWSFLTVGITLGSWWAYYELGWGGWWFWDPVENISLMPWIAGLALVHSLLMIRGEQAIEKWIVFLAILCFSLSILGTFLVRSGILTSVHSFASDASRGLFILLIFFLTTGFGFLIFLIKTPSKKDDLHLLLINKTSALIINNILMMITVFTILLGTIYPIIIEVLTNKRISVGGPYFNSTVLPILLPGFLLMSIAPVLSWKTNQIKKFRIYVICFLILSLIVSLQSYFTSFNTWGFIGLILGSWIIIASIISIMIRHRFSFTIKYITSINSFIAHIGVGVMIIGVTFSSIYQKEYNFNIEVGDKVSLENEILKFNDMQIIEEKNYQSLKANISIKKKNGNIIYIKPGKNYYPVSKMITTEAGIYHDWFKDIYITLGSENNNIWFIRVLINPLVSFIWLGVIIMVFSSAIAVIKK